jgi:hypothetical protein
MGGKAHVRLLKVVASCLVVLLLGCDKAEQTAKPVPPDTPEVATAWVNITDQMKTYQVLQGLTGTERIQAANKIVFGYPQLKKDVEYFLAHTGSNDPRRVRVAALQVAMEDAERKTNSNR